VRQQSTGILGDKYLRPEIDDGHDRCTSRITGPTPVHLRCLYKESITGFLGHTHIADGIHLGRARYSVYQAIPIMGHGHKSTYLH